MIPLTSSLRRTGMKLAPRLSTRKVQTLLDSVCSSILSPLRITHLIMACPPEKPEIYRASKTEAEKAAWKFIEEGKAAFDISTVNPPLIFGPILHDCRSPKSLNTSILAFYNFLIGAKKDEDAIAVGGNYVDVRDVAQFHIDALITEGAANQRLACCAGTFLSHTIHFASFFCADSPISRSALLPRHFGPPSYSRTQRYRRIVPQNRSRTSWN